jgi:hypothetical protein
MIPGPVEKHRGFELSGPDIVPEQAGGCPCDAALPMNPKQKHPCKFA